MGSGYEQQGIGIYILLEIYCHMLLAILPFVWRRRYSNKRKTDIELVDGDDDSEEEIGRDSLLSQSSRGYWRELIGERAAKLMNYSLV